MKTRFIQLPERTPMVQAILEGRKTQFRRILKIKGCKPFVPDSSWSKEEILRWNAGYHPYGQPGDVIWVRETWQEPTWMHPSNDEYGYIYKASENGKAWEANDEAWTWKPSIRMPKEACRLWLRIKSVRVERLQEISTEDAIAEGIERNTAFPKLNNAWKHYGKEKGWHHSKPIGSFNSLWQSINGQESWDANPYVWVIEFEKLDAMPEGFLTEK